MSTELNKKLLDVIDKHIFHSPYDTNRESENAKQANTIANECEKIALQAQIDLLIRVRVGLIQRGVIDDYIKELQEKLNQLK